MNNILKAIGLVLLSPLFLIFIGVALLIDTVLNGAKL